MSLTPTGARILHCNDNGVVSGHPAAMARLEADGLVVPHNAAAGTHRMTETGRKALDEWRQTHGAPAAPLATIPPKLPKKVHEAVVTAAQRPDQLVPGRDDQAAYWAGETWFRGPTLRAVHAAGYADIRPTSWDPEPMTYEQTGRSLFLTPAGRAYARVRGNIDVRRRRIVIIACGDKKLPDPGLNEYGNPNPGYPAGKLYIGDYHVSLRSAADTLTSPSLIRIASALHGLVDLQRPLHPYNVRPGDPRAVTPERIASDAAELGTDDADVIFLGGQDYVDLLRPSIPHLFAPLTGGMGSQRGQCKQARESAGRREVWWKTAAALHEKHHATQRTA
ncbi:hypothetical protein KUF83_30180 [Streptomyces sp. BV286]|uniref:DUF6884 domain-containing protein n=1 Tax=Streptomyces sp. BV286 TaxID=2849672 RepID=UPI001C2E7CA3|nr:DUF6884 domain-containing protein [Streptomyces sp. BV286]MBV1940805.1 hypothetical protein [Streptomyces sp. BV286]